MAVATASARRGVSRRERELFRIVNSLPDAAFPAVWLPMQYGTYGTVPAVAAVALARGDRRLALTLLTGGTAAWVAAKAVKPLASRGRPLATLPDVRLRGTITGDRGFPSGHATVSAALTVAAWPSVSGRRRRQLLALAAFVPLVRVYVGAHLPLDVIGGSALGVAVGCAVDLAVRPSRSGGAGQGGRSRSSS
ncbi:MAG: phosphatase PAP2 family protein [Actinomycetota bacterium]